MTDYFNTSISKGELIKPWLMLGPFYEDVSAQVEGLSLFENVSGAVGRPVMAEVAEEAAELLAISPKEGDPATFRGKSGYWNFVRRPDEYLAWGTYNISNHLGSVFLSTIITPEEAGTRRWSLAHMMAEHVFVAINGKIVWDNRKIPFEKPSGLKEYSFEADLQPGENVLSVGLFRLARMAQVGCRLQVDTDMEARVDLNMPIENRIAIEESVRSIRLERDIFYPEHPIGFSVGQNADGGIIKAELTEPGGETLTEISDVKIGDVILRKATTNGTGAVSFANGTDIPDGAYQIHCTWLDANKQFITSTTYDIRVVTPVAPLPGYDHMAERKQKALAHYTNDTGGDRPIWGPVASYALGRYDEVDEELIAKTCRFIADRKDCADFAIQGLLRLMYWENEEQHLSPQINAMMKDTVLGFKYWIDEPGDTVMYMGSENHRLLFHVAEWMAGQLFPNDIFTNTGQTGLFHALKGQYYISEWLRQRGRFGFNEWHSNSYYPICFAPLINVYDFSQYENDKILTIGSLAKDVLDMMFFNLAADSYQGIFGTTHGRSYGVNLKYPDFEGTTATCWLLFGVGSMVAGTSGMAPVSIASSSYELPPILAKMATDDQAVIHSKIRQGLMKAQDQHAFFTVYRTPDYMLCGLQDHKKGQNSDAIMPGQVTLGNKAVIFWSAPRTSSEGSGLRPDYWSGSTSLPRVIQHKNVLSLSYQLQNFAWMSHCFFEQSRFDEVRVQDNWAFARVGAGYVGIYSQNGLKLGEDGQYAGRELQCPASENTWIVECGRQADWGDFDAFVAALSAAKVTTNAGAVSYESPSVGTFVTGWAAKPTIDGEAVQLRDYQLVESDWAYSRFGSGEMTLRYGDDAYHLWFNQ